MAKTQLFVQLLLLIIGASLAQGEIVNCSALQAHGLPASLYKGQGAKPDTSILLSLCARVQVKASLLARPAPAAHPPLQPTRPA
jgi:hypothetical protein